jgi:hypothetical protein
MSMSMSVSMSVSTTMDMQCMQGWLSLTADSPTGRHLRLELIPRNTDGSADTRRLGDLGASEAVHVHLRVEQRVQFERARKTKLRKSSSDTGAVWCRAS